MLRFPAFQILTTIWAMDTRYQTPRMSRRDTMRVSNDRYTKWSIAQSESYSERWQKLSLNHTVAAGCGVTECRTFPGYDSDVTKYLILTQQINDNQVMQTEVHILRALWDAACTADFTNWFDSVSSTQACLIFFLGSEQDNEYMMRSRRCSSKLGWCPKLDQQCYLIPAHQIPKYYSSTSWLDKFLSITSS